MMNDSTMLIDEIIIFITIGLVLIEVILFILISWLKKDFQWLITSNDENVIFKSSEIKKFMKNSYDEKLGWDRKANITKSEKVKGVGEHKSTYSTSNYSTNSLSERNNPGHEQLIKKIITYGDSYTFCRHVNDDETWQWFLSEHTNTNVVNLGVGNYGLDQAYVKMNKTVLDHKDTAEVVIMTVVPETIVRIVNVWKHFYEYGNIYGFKGRYFYKEKDLVWIDNIINDVLIEKKNDWVNKIKEQDYCYENKFKKDILTFPYSLSLIKSYKRNLLLIYYLLQKKFLSLMGLTNDKIANNAWNHVMKCNHNFTKSLYKNKEVLNLLKTIVRKFAKSARDLNLKPIFLMIPYLEDLNKSDNSSLYYVEFINEIKNNVTTIDLGEVFVKKGNVNDLYVSDSIGAHLNKSGNKIVADTIKDIL